MTKHDRLPAKFSLSGRFVPADSPRDILWGGTDLTRDVRSQEVGNCWTYPSINSFESSLIRLGLADRSIHGSEWSLTTLHANTFDRGFSIKPDPDNLSRYKINEDGNFGGLATYAIQYFSTGADGAIHLSTSENTKEIESLFKDVNLGLNESDKAQKNYLTGWSIYEPLSAAPLFPDPKQPRSFGYDQALIGISQEETKQLLLENGLYGEINFSVGKNEPLGFFSFLDQATESNDAGDWIAPASLGFKDKNNQQLSKDQLVEQLTRKSDRFKVSNAFMQEFFGTNPGVKNGGGHAVAVLGWDDNYQNPKVDFTVQLIKDFNGRIKSLSKQDPSQAEDLMRSLEGFVEFLSSNRITYTNEGSRSKGAWIIQNSWGSDQPGLEYQYLPYEMAGLLSEADLRELSNVELSEVFPVSQSTAFHMADSSGLFGPVQSSSTAIPGSSIWSTSGHSWHGLGYRFEPQHSEVVAIGSYLQPNVAETITGENGSIEYRYTSEGSDSQWLQATLWRASDLLNANPETAAQPIARSRIEQAFTGYQTVEFDQPVNLDAFGDEPLFATLQLYGDAGASQPLSNARLLSYAPDPVAIAKRQEQLASPDFSSDPNSPDYYKHLPVPLLNPDPLQSLPQQRFYGLNTTGKLTDLGTEGQVVALNVVYADPNVLTTSKSNQITGSISSDQVLVTDDTNQVRTEAGNDLMIAEGNNNSINLGLGNDRLINAGINNRLRTGSGSDTVMLRPGSSGSQLVLGKGRDAVVAVDAQDNDLVISGGKGGDTYVFAENKHLHFIGQATITDLQQRDRIILRGFDAEDLRIRQLPGAAGVKLQTNEFEIRLQGDGALADTIFDQITLA